MQTVLQPVLVLAGDAHDHADCSLLESPGGLGLDRRGALGARTKLSGARGGWATRPDFALELRQVIVDRGLARQRFQLAIDVVFAGPERSDIIERAGRFELLHRVGTGLHVFGLVNRALHRQADVGHLLAHARGRFGDLHLSFGGGVLSLDDLLLGAEGFDLRAQLLLGLGQLLLLVFQFGDLRVEPLQLGLGDVLAFKRGAREVFLAGGHRLAGLRVELDDLLLQRRLLQLQALLGGHHVGDALLDVLQLFDLLLIAVVERLGGVFGAIQELGDLGLHDG